jgi:hypothetical protein
MPGSDCRFPQHVQGHPSVKASSIDARLRECPCLPGPLEAVNGQDTIVCDRFATILVAEVQRRATLQRSQRNRRHRTEKWNTVEIGFFVGRVWVISNSVFIGRDSEVENAGSNHSTPARFCKNLDISSGSLTEHVLPCPFTRTATPSLTPCEPN